MSQMSMETLLALQNLAADKTYKSKESKLETKTGDGESYQDIWAKVKKEQEEWDKTLNEYDLTKYKLGLMDSFWSQSTKVKQTPAKAQSAVIISPGLTAKSGY